MGLFADLVYCDGQWREEPVGDRYLAITIHDSDLAIVDYQPAGAGEPFYLGYEPRDYFDNPQASAPVNQDRAVTGFITWARDTLAVDVSPDKVTPLLATDTDPATPFVEYTVIDLIALLGLPLPSVLTVED